MDAGIWSQLPLEIVERVLTFLQVPDLCRCQSVCKKWNGLINKPAFATRHAHNAKRRGVSFIAMNFTRKERKETWALLALSERRWYKVPETVHNRGHHFATGVTREVSEVMAMDGGLVCRFSLPDSENSEVLSIIVHDLLGYTVKRLPPTPRHLISLNLPKLHMVVDTQCYSFKIFLVNHAFQIDPNELVKLASDPFMRMYDSAINEWKNCTNPCWDESVNSGGVGYISSIAMHGGVLYVSSEDGLLRRYNVSEDVWQPSEKLATFGNVLSGQVVTSANRLFLVSWFSKYFLNFVKFESVRETMVSKSWFSKGFEVFEIQSPGVTRERICKLSVADVETSFDIKPGMDSRNLNLGISVIGFENSLFVMSESSGVSKVFDLQTRSWDHGLPKYPLKHVPNERGYPWVGKHMNLLLPNTLW